MADVFISYSRKDTAFVRRLSDALEQRQREAWVDWEGIRPTEEFMLAIYAAIEGTNTFIFILTPDSVGSEVCAKEIGHAAKHNKRFIPIVHRDIDAKSVPETLAKLNWIFCREADDFASRTSQPPSRFNCGRRVAAAQSEILRGSRVTPTRRRSSSVPTRASSR